MPQARGGGSPSSAALVPGGDRTDAHARAGPSRGGLKGLCKICTVPWNRGFSDGGTAEKGFDPGAGPS